MKLYIFNPDSDIALANNDVNYMAPASARRMAEDLALLPIWYAQPGSIVLAASAYNIDYLQGLKELFPLAANVLTVPELKDCTEVQVVPWGWNPSLCKWLNNNGVPLGKLPSVKWQDKIRWFSSRILAYRVLLEFRQEAFCCGESFCLENEQDCEAFVKHYKPCVLKAPWSGSGKGLNWCNDGNYTSSVAGWCKRILKDQQAVMGEPVYDKVEDFAMEFYADGHGRVVFVGYSLFATNAKGAYSGNILASSDALEKHIAAYISILRLIRIREKVQENLSYFVGACYKGYLGVDMMICRDQNEEGSYLVHPCVEINMRMNMGIVAHSFYENFMVSGVSGNFMVEYYESNEKLVEEHRRAQEMFPLVMEEGRMLSGYLSLVPVTPQSKYRAYVTI